MRISLLFFTIFFCTSIFAQNHNEYYDNGQLRAQGEIRNNKRVGKWKLFHKNGKLSATGEYKTDGHPKAGTWTTYDDKGQKDGVNSPEPYPSQIRNLCNEVDSQELYEVDERNYTYTFEQSIEAMAAIDLVNDNPEQVKKKVQAWWNKYHDGCKCSRTNFAVSNGNILKFAVQSNFESFVGIVTRIYGLELNFIDPADGFTVLDFSKAELDKKIRVAPTHPNTLEAKKIFELLRKNGALYASEMGK